MNVPEMTKVESFFCRSTPWNIFTSRLVLPWALQGERLEGDALEIGGGSGAMAEAVLARNPRLKLTVTDYDGAMVDTARKRLERFGDRVEVRRADATALDFPGSTFDHVLSFIMLHHVLDWEKALAEAMRVLKPGGTLVGYDILKNIVMHKLHESEKAGTRLMSVSELRSRFDELPLAEARLRTSPFAVRFTLVKEG